MTLLLFPRGLGHTLSDLRPRLTRLLTLLRMGGRGVYVRVDDLPVKAQYHVAWSVQGVSHCPSQKEAEMVLVDVS